MLSRALTASLAAALLATPGLAADATTHEAELQIGTLIGGQDLVIDLRSNVPSSLCAVFIGISGLPTPAIGALPAWGLDISTATMLVLPTDTTGRMRIDVPTAPGFYGPVVDVPLWFQAMVPRVGKPRQLSNAVSVAVEPTPVFPGFLVDDAAARLPAGYDSLSAYSLAHGDLDGDGFEDVVFLTDLEVHAWVNDGAGVFSDASAGLLPGYTLRDNGSVDLVDVDQDNDLDLVLAGGYDASDSVDDQLWLNDGLGGFSLDGSFPAGDGQSQGFEFGDFDGDSILDFVRPTGPETHLVLTGGTDRLFLGQGDGTFVEDAAFAAAAWNDPTLPTSAMRAGDMDNDGDLDLFVGRQDTAGVDGIIGQPNSLLLNDGFGGFVDATLTNLSAAPSDNTQDVELADLDLDGDLDVIIANSHASVAGNLSGDLYINQGGDQGGTLGFLLEDTLSDLEISTPADWIRLGVQAEDLDADGDLDVFMPVHDLFSGANQLLFLNQGGAQGGTLGVLVREFAFDPGDYISYAASIFDVDDDGDQDVLQAASGVVSGDPLLGDDMRLFINTRL